MQSVRTLALKRERIAELSTDDLAAIAAGAPPTTNTKECPDYTYYCITGYAMCHRPTNTLTCP